MCSCLQLFITENKIRICGKEKDIILAKHMLLLVYKTTGYTVSGHSGYPVSGHSGYPVSGHSGYPTFR